MVSVSIKKPRKFRDLLASTLRGLINGMLINRIHFCCQARNLIDDQIEKFYIDFGHEVTGVGKPWSSWPLFLRKTMEKRKGFFDRHAFSWDKELGGEHRTHKAEEVIAHYHPY